LPATAQNPPRTGPVACPGPAPPGPWHIFRAQSGDAHQRLRIQQQRGGHAAGKRVVGADEAAGE
jgi:hypothetical protein